MNKTKVLYGIPRDPDVAAALAEMEEAETAGEEERPKVRQCVILCDIVRHEGLHLQRKKARKDPSASSGKKGKAANVPNAPALNRIPLPPL